MGNYRDRLQIIADILSIASKRAKKTQIMYQANLSYKLLVKYLGEVLEVGLVSFKDECYMLTAKGEAFLLRHEEYSKRCKNLKKQFDHVNDVKNDLEKMCSNTDIANCRLHRLERKKKASA